MEYKKMSLSEVLQDLKKELAETGITDESYRAYDDFVSGEFFGIDYAIRIIEENLMPENKNRCIDVKCPNCGTVSKVVLL